MQPIRKGRPEAAAAIWDWQGGHAQTPEHVEPGRVRLRGSLQAAIGLTVGTLIFLYGSQTFAIAVLTIASVVFLSALLSPMGVFAVIERLFAALGRALGRTLTWIILPAVFYLVFVPYGRLFRRGRSDAMQRFFDSETASYWSLRERGRTASDSRAWPY